MLSTGKTRRKRKKIAHLRCIGLPRRNRRFIAMAASFPDNLAGLSSSVVHRRPAEDRDTAFLEPHIRQIPSRKTHAD